MFSHFFQMWYVDFIIMYIYLHMGHFNKGKTPNIATEFAEIAEIAMVFLKIAKIAIRLSKPPA